VNDFPLIPTMKLNGFSVAAHTARTASRSADPAPSVRPRPRPRKLSAG
jgi:hypothetical protein